ncbi:MAG TPA: chemotaxis protein CheW [Thermoanaerobaculia bacterium]|jgi:purine-binding chemotaxis protein CheW|nr:chemotaxis protein CheW [Thermoanaerobaculia bacterium]
MVDLVKLRKKAKGARVAEVPPSAAETAGVGSRESEQGPAFEPVAPTQSAKPTLEQSAPTPDTRHPTPSDAPTPDTRPAKPSDHKLAQFRENVGKKREGFIEEEAASSAGDQVELLTFVLAGEQYAVSIDHIVEIVTPRPATHIPNADRSIVGIMSLRGTIVTVVDVRQKLGHPPKPGSSDTRTIVAERNGETLGFEVDRVLRVLKVGTSAIEPHPVVHASEQSEAVRGVFRHANALTILLDLDKLLA